MPRKTVNLSKRVRRETQERQTRRLVAHTCGLLMWNARKVRLGWTRAPGLFLVAQGPGLSPGPQKAVNQTLRGPQMTITLRGSSQARGPMVPVATAIRAVPGAEARESGKGQ